MKDFKYLKDTFSKLYLRTNNKQANDFNFFSPYIVKKREVKNKYLYFVSLGGVLLFIFVGSFIWNYIKINKMQKEISEMKKVINSSEMQVKIREADSLTKKYDISMKYNEQAKNISNAINKKQVIDSDLIRKISSELPQSVSLKTMSIDSENIQIQGTSGSRVNIGEFQYNLKQLEDIKDVQVITINKGLDSNNKNSTTQETSGGFTFTIKCTLKDVESNEN